MRRLPPARRAATALLLAAALSAGAAQAQPIVTDPARARVFDLPDLARGAALATRLVEAGRVSDALGVARRIAERFPDLPDAALLEARIAARAGRGGRARAALGRAIDRGLVRAPMLAATPGLAALLDDPLLAGRLAEARETPRPVPRPAYLAPPEPAPIAEGVARVTARNTGWDAGAGLLRARFLPPRDAGRREIAGTSLPGTVHERLTELHARGRAAGNAGDLYDNRDRDHSTLRPGLLPQLAFVEYGPAAKARRVDYGPTTELAFDRPVFGNSSTAITGGRFWRSQARQLLTQPGGPEALFRQYVSNQLYIFPEHRDHDPETGDLFPARTPYTLVSQGSSGSDRPLMRAVGVALAALPPAAKRRAAAEGLIAPLLQKLIAETIAPGAPGGEGYFSGAAHPTAIDARIDLDRLIDRAQAQRAATLPPMVRLDVVSETAPEPGRTVFSAGMGQRLFDTPSAIARIHRTTEERLVLRVSAAATRDPNGRPLRFAWRVLRGDAARIRITPGDPAGRSAELSIPWHAPYPVPGRPELSTHRVDIGVFAHNGAEWSAPAFVSIAYPPGQTRRYDEDGRVLEIAYPRAADPAYADPRLFLRQGWTDRYSYGADGRLLGWTRRRGATVEEYTADGRRVLARGADGTVAAAEPVAYRRVQLDGGGVGVAVEPASPPG